MYPVSSFELKTVGGSVGLEVIGRSTPKAESFVERHQVTVRLTATIGDHQTQSTTGVVHVGDFSRFTFEMEKIAERCGRMYLQLPLSQGRMTLLHQADAYELAYYEPHRTAPTWLLPLSIEDVRRLSFGLDGLYEHFKIDAVATVAPEPSETIRQWLPRFVAEIAAEDPYLSVDALRRRGWGAVMCLNDWLTYDIVRVHQLMVAINRLQADDLLVHAFIALDRVPQPARIPATADGLLGYLTDIRYRPVDNVLITSPKGDFAVTVSYESLMVAAGPPSFLREAFDGFLSEARLELRRGILCAQPIHGEEHCARVIAHQDYILNRDRQYAELLET